jgi:hypothetical protein
MTKGTTKSLKSGRKIRPAIDPEARENQMIALAVDLAERQLQEGTASSQVITHFLKLGTTKAELEKEKLRRENKVLEAKAKAYQTGEEMKELYENAIKAMRDYAGQGDPYEYYNE